MSSDELLCTRKNWNRVILEGRKPGQTIGIGCGASHEPLDKVGKALFADLRRVAEVLTAKPATANTSRCAMSWSPRSTILS